MRDVIAVVVGSLVALGLLVLGSVVLNAATGHPLGAAPFLLLALVVFPLCVGLGLYLTRRRARRQPEPSER